MMSTYNMTIANSAMAPQGGAWSDCPLDPPLANRKDTQSLV